MPLPVAELNASSHVRSDAAVTVAVSAGKCQHVATSPAPQPSREDDRPLAPARRAPRHEDLDVADHAARPFRARAQRSVNARYTAAASASRPCFS